MLCQGNGVTLYHDQRIREFTDGQHSATVPLREVWWMNKISVEM